MVNIDIQKIIEKLKALSDNCEIEKHDNMLCNDCGYTWETSVKHLPDNPIKEPVCPRCGSQNTMRLK